MKSFAAPIFALASLFLALSASAETIQLGRGETATVNCTGGTIPDVLSDRGSSLTVQCARLCKVRVVSGNHLSCARDGYTIYITVPGQSLTQEYCGMSNARAAAEKIVADWEAHNGCDRIVATGF